MKQSTIITLAILAVLLLGGGGYAVVTYMGKRGIRNNNPGNIRKDGTIWQGMAPAAQQTDPDFIIFSSPEYGLRAMARILGNYFKRGSNTVRKVVTTWAPPTENDTAAYIADVAKQMGVSPDKALLPSDLPALIAALVRHEDGSNPYTSAQIQTGINMATTA